MFFSKHCCCFNNICSLHSNEVVCSLWQMWVSQVLAVLANILLDAGALLLL
jgi:hypothetical protein